MVPGAGGPGHELEAGNSGNAEIGQTECRQGELTAEARDADGLQEVRERLDNGNQLVERFDRFDVQEAVQARCGERDPRRR